MKKHTFQSKLENIAEGMNYFAVSVPAKITGTLKTKGPVPVSAKVNGSEAFIASFYPVGDGRHYLRIKNKICKSVEIEAGDRVRIEFTVRDREAEVKIPKDLMIALQDEGVVAAFKALPIGKRSYLLRLIEESVRPQTRAKKIQAAVDEAHRKKESLSP